MNQMVCYTQRVGGDRQSRIDPSARREERTVDDIEVRERMSTVHRVENTRGGVRAKSASATCMGYPFVIFCLFDKQSTVRFQGDADTFTKSLDPLSIVLGEAVSEA